jgi:hypothetical protein
LRTAPRNRVFPYLDTANGRLSSQRDGHRVRTYLHHFHG